MNWVGGVRSSGSLKLVRSGRVKLVWSVQSFRSIRCIGRSSRFRQTRLFGSVGLAGTSGSVGSVELGSGSFRLTRWVGLFWSG